MLVRIVGIGTTITVNVLIWWAIWSFFMSLGAAVGWIMAIVCYLIVLYVTIKNLGNYLMWLQIVVMTIAFSLIMCGKYFIFS